MSESKKNPIPNYRWHITIVFAIVFAMIGFGIGWSIDTQHPDDRLADILIPTFVFLTAGLLIGYVASLVLYKRFNWFDALVSFAIPPLCFFGFLLAKSGDWTTGRMLGYVALGLVAFLVWRFWQTSRQHVQSDLKRSAKTRVTRIDA